MDINSKINFISVVRTNGAAENLEKEIHKALPDANWTFTPLIGYDPETKQGETLLSGYTKAGKESTDDILVFLHDDVRIMSNSSLREELVMRMQHPMTGFVGVAGTARLGRSGRWWDPENRAALSGLVFHPVNPEQPDGPYGFSVYGPYRRVAVLDGVFLACRKDVFDSLEGFHMPYLKQVPGEDLKTREFDFYDIDTTFRATLEGYVNWTVPILLKHSSPGQTEGRNSWHSNRHDFVTHYAPYLPLELP